MFSFLLSNHMCLSCCILQLSFKSKLIVVPEGKSERMLVLNYLLMSSFSLTACYVFCWKCNSCSEGDDICQSRLVDSCFLRTDSGLNIDISTSCKQDKLTTYKTKESRDQKNERITVQLCSSKNIENSPVLKREYVDVSPNSSAESLNHSSIEASEIHQSSMEQGSHSGIHSKQQQFQRTGSTGLSRKDSLTKAQLYGTLLN